MLDAVGLRFLPEDLSLPQSDLSHDLSELAGLSNLHLDDSDPNWDAFKKKCKGHFIGEEHKETFDKVISKVEQIFDLHIAAAPQEKFWHSIHEEAKQSLSHETIWHRLSQEEKGTCFGNSVALGSAILQANRILSLDELAHIEASKSFEEIAQAIQLVTSIAGRYNSALWERGLLESDLNHEERLEALGISLEAYQNSPYRDKIDQFLASGIRKEDLLGPLDNFWKLDESLFPQAIKLQKEFILRKGAIPLGLIRIEEFELYPIKKMLPPLCFDVDRMPEIEWLPLINSSEFKGFILLAGLFEDASGHAMLLQVDRQKKVFTLYDNDYGFYQWDDFSICLGEIQKRLENEGYVRCEFLTCPLEDQA